MSNSPYLLIIDDDRGIQALLRMTLQGEGYPLQIVADGESALQTIRTARPALILLDMHMPNMGGTEFLTHYMAEPPPHPPVIILTANQTGLLPTPVCEVLIKPFELDELLAAVKKHFPQESLSLLQR